MNSRIIQRYSDGILQEAIQRYGIPKDGIKAIDTFESFIYEYEKEGKGYILRIGHSMRKNKALIQGEVDWIKRFFSTWGRVCGPSRPFHKAENWLRR